MNRLPATDEGSVGKVAAIMMLEPYAEMKYESARKSALGS